MNTVRDSETNTPRLTNLMLTTQLPACRTSGGSCSKAGVEGPRSPNRGRCSRTRRHRRPGRRHLLTFWAGWRQRWLLCWPVSADNKKHCCCRRCFHISEDRPLSKTPLDLGWFSNPGSCRSHAGCSRRQLLLSASLPASALPSMSLSTSSTFLSVASSPSRLTWCCCFPCRCCSRWCATSGKIKRSGEFNELK